LLIERLQNCLPCIKHLLFLGSYQYRDLLFLTASKIFRSQLNSILPVFRFNSSILFWNFSKFDSKEYLCLGQHFVEWNKISDFKYFLNYSFPGSSWKLFRLILLTQSAIFIIATIKKCFAFCISVFASLYLIFWFYRRPKAHVPKSPEPLSFIFLYFIKKSFLMSKMKSWYSLTI